MKKIPLILAILNANFYLLLTVQRTPIQYCAVNQLHKSNIKQYSIWDKSKAEHHVPLKLILISQNASQFRQFLRNLKSSFNIVSYLETNSLGFVLFSRDKWKLIEFCSLI